MAQDTYEPQQQDDDAEYDTYEGTPCARAGSTLQVGLAGVAQDSRVGIRFPSVLLDPERHVVLSAYLKIRYASNQDGWSVTIRGDDVDDSSVFDAANCNADARTKTTASVAHAWPSGSTGDWKTSPDLKTIIDEIIDRGGWASGNAMSILQFNAGGDVGAVNFYSYDGGSSPQLEINYHSKHLTGAMI